MAQGRRTTTHHGAYRLPVAIWVDVTDYVRYSGGPDPLSGVQRVVAEVAPRLEEAHMILWDVARARWVQIPPDHSTALIDQGSRQGSALTRDQVRQAAQTCLDELPTFPEAHFEHGDVLVQLGSPWIDQGVLLATERAAAQGVAIVAYLFDLTPVQGAGHSIEVATGFRRYLAFLAKPQARVATISQATRDNLNSYLTDHGLPIPQGKATGLPPGLRPEPHVPAPDTSSWPRPYVLMVGTIEARKGHVTAFRAWQELPADSRPDLVCVGKWGWGSEEFRAEWEAACESESGVHVLADGVDDRQLSDLYAGCIATIYPSRWEGWGLPVSESLAFGKLPVTTNVSSLPEAGAGLAILIPPDDPQALAEAVTTHVLDEEQRTQHEKRIAESDAYRNPKTWQHVAEQIEHEIRQAQTMERAPVTPPELEVGREYVLGVPAPVQDASIVRIEAIAADRGSPLLGQPLDSDDVIVTDAVLSGTFAEPTAWGYPVLPGGEVDLRFTVPSNAPLTLLIATAPIVGAGTIDVTVDDAPTQRVPLGYGEVITADIPAGSERRQVRIHIEVIAQDKADGLPLTLQSLLLLQADDPNARITVFERIARSRTVQLQEAEHTATALREQLTDVMTSKSWRITAPLRRITGDER